LLSSLSVGRQWWIHCPGAPAHRAWIRGVTPVVVVAFVAEVLPHARPVALLEMRVVVLVPGPRPGQKHRSRPLAQPGDQVISLAQIVEGRVRGFRL
jgi:hypothetical protein